jgi:hypothetical protein
MIEKRGTGSKFSRIWFLSPAFILTALAAAGCVRLAPRQAVDEPKAFIDRHVFAAAVEKSGEWAEPRDEKDVFVKGRDASVFSFVSLKDLQDEHTLAWKWYDPAGRLYRSTDPIKIGLADRLFARYIAWDEIRVFAEQDDGRWTLVVYLDGAVALSARFEIK